MDVAPVNASTVNIVMRTKNRPLLLQRAVDDVIRQNFTDWTLTVVNDGGSSATVDEILATRAGELRGRVQVIHRPVSLGMESASNEGVRASSARFVAIHDDDDSWDPGFLAATVAWLRDHEAAVAVAVRTEIIWESVDRGGITELRREVFLPSLEAVTLAQLVRFNTCVPISMLHRRESLERIGLFDESLSVVGDWHANLMLARLGEIGFIGARPLAFWHQRPAATGEMSNSVISGRDDHRLADAAVRDRELRSYVAEAGLGLPLYLTRFFDDRFDEMRESIARVEAVASDRFSHKLARLVKRASTRLARRDKPNS